MIRSDRIPNLNTDAQQNSLRLDNLPTEIQDLIFHHVVADSTIAELKRFRQSNRYFRDRANIYLFSKLHVSASNLSLDRIRFVAESQGLSKHVKELVFHRGTFSGHKMISFRLGVPTPKGYDDFETYMLRGDSTFRPAPADMLRVGKCYAAFADEVKAEAEYNIEMTWRTSLMGYCSHFPNLEALTTLAAEDDTESEYLRRRCGLDHQSWTPNYFAPYEIFGCCGPAFKPRSLTMDSVNGEDFAAIVTNIRGSLSVFRERFSQLRHLKLGFSETVGSLSIKGTYDVFMQAACPSLTSLSVDFTSFYSSKLLADPKCFPQVFIRLILHQQFPRLAHLQLTYPLMTESDFTAFLALHVPQQGMQGREKRLLTHIHLNRWPMPVDPDTGAPTGSVTRTLWQIGQLNSAGLARFKVEGELSSAKSGDGLVLSAHDVGRSQSQYHAVMNPRPGEHVEYIFAHDPETMIKAKSAAEIEALDAWFK